MFLFIVLCAGVILSMRYSRSLIETFWPVSLWELERAGQFGDQFGVATALFSGLAFAGFLVALLMQQQELALQREQHRKALSVMELERKEFQKHSAAMDRQNFEAMFFRMLEVLRECREDLKCRKLHSQSEHMSGIAACQEAKRHLERQWPKKDIRHLAKVYKIDHYTAIANDAYTDRYRSYFQDTFGRYFRIAYHTLKFIDDTYPRVNGKPTDTARRYSRIYRAEFSQPELVMLMYNCASKLGSDNFKPLADAYDMYDNLPPDDLIDPSHRVLSGSRFYGDPKDANPSG